MNYESTPIREHQILEPQPPRLLDEVRSGMSVYDSTGERIGEVSYVYLGAASEKELERGEGPARDLAIDDAGNNSFVEMLVGAFSAEEIPAEMVERMRRHGFVRIDSNGLFASDRFATAEQVATVTKDQVHLNATYDQLLTSE